MCSYYIIYELEMELDIICLESPKGVPLDAGDQNEASHGVAGHAQMILKSD
jgi:hypothetical protein